MSPKWATQAQEEYLEAWYKDYQQLRRQGSKLAFKEFWVNVISEWKRVFGWSAENDEDEKGAPCLEKVSDIIERMKGEETDIWNSVSINGITTEASMESGHTAIMSQQESHLQSSKSCSYGKHLLC